MLSIEQLKTTKSKLLAATVRDFSGGYNVLDTDINLSTKYAKKLYNCFHTAANTIKVRYGTEFFVDLRLATSDLSGYVVNMEYYNAAVIAVMSNGEVVSILGDKTVTRIWDATKAAALPNSPSGWSATTFVSFEQFNGELIICNGVDKPLIVNTAFEVDYLQDLATLTNLNVPICRYVCATARYLIMAGDPLFPNRIHISSRDTSGTWYGDPAPNDGTYIDVGSSLSNASIIKGIRGFRGNLIIAFEEGIIIGILGNYNEDGDHTPNVDETIKQYGAISHRAMIDSGDDMLMMDGIGVPSLKRTTFTGTIRPERVSELIDLEMSGLMSELSMLSLEERCFTVYNQREGAFMFFIPDNDVPINTTQTTCYQYLFRPSLKVSSWARFDNMNWTCACRSQAGSVFFGDLDGKVWLYGSDLYPIYKDRQGDPDVNDGEGESIMFDWELPWSDMNKRNYKKKSKYLQLDTIGTGYFTVSMYTDQIRYNDQLEDTPLLTMNFVGGDSGGFGGADGSFGSGRVTSDEHLYKWPADFMLMKMRFSGTVENALEFVAVSVLYQVGGFFR